MLLEKIYKNASVQELKLLKNRANTKLAKIFLNIKPNIKIFLEFSSSDHETHHKLKEIPKELKISTKINSISKNHDLMTETFPQH